jgi:hypothetical protein
MIVGKKRLRDTERLQVLITRRRRHRVSVGHDFGV